MLPFNPTDQSWGDASAPSTPEDEAPNMHVGLKIEPNPLLKEIPAKYIKQAWFIMSHLILESGAKVLNMRAQDGAITYAMATMNPTMEFIGLEESAKAVKEAQKKYKLPNLKYINHDIHKNFIPLESVDAIVNSFNLHEKYSESNFNEQVIIDRVARQIKLLKKGGYIFTQGYIMRPEDEYVIVEMPDEPSRSEDIKDLSEIDLLIHYSKHARPRDRDGYQGFYLEELPARYPRTRLFRLPAKWAYEFLLKKDQRSSWEHEIKKEYSFFTRHDFTRMMRSFGARILYSAPHWNEEILKNHYNKKLKLFTEDGELMGSPETSFVMVSQKTSEKESLTLTERKPSNETDPVLYIMAMRDTESEYTYDIVSRNQHITEILPYYVSENDELFVYIHEGIPRCLVNTVPRKAPNIDGKQWSGHLTETFSVPRSAIDALDTKHFRSVLKFTNKYMGLTPQMNNFFEDGPGFYPAPDCIDEHVETLYINVKKEDGSTKPQKILDDVSGFSINGSIRAINAQQLLDAVGVGFLPSSRLEVQILALYELLGVSYQSWAQCALTLQTEDPQKATRIEEIISKLSAEDDRYEGIKGTVGQIKTMQSVFVDEGQNKGGITGLAAREKDFIINEEGSMNMAVVLPLTRQINGEVMAGIVEQYLPVPQRYKGNGFIIGCPSFELPTDITNFDMARRFIAETFEVELENVARMGESYFSHVGVTPQRIFPFAVSTAGTTKLLANGRSQGVTSFAPIYDLHRLMYLDNHDSFIKITAMAHQSLLGLDSDLSNNVSFSEKHIDRKTGFVSLKTDKISNANETPSSEQEIKYD